MIVKEDFKISPDTIYWSIVLLSCIIGVSFGYNIGFSKGKLEGWRDGVRDEKIGTLEELIPLNKEVLSAKNDIERKK